MPIHTARLDLLSASVAVLEAELDGDGSEPGVIRYEHRRTWVGNPLAGSPV